MNSQARKVIEAEISPRTEHEMEALLCLACKRNTEKVGTLICNILLEQGRVNLYRR